MKCRCYAYMDVGDEPRILYYELENANILSGDILTVGGITGKVHNRSWHIDSQMLEIHLEEFGTRITQSEIENYVSKGWHIFR